MPSNAEAFVEDALADIVINADTVGTASDINTVINTADADIDTNNARFPWTPTVFPINSLA